MLARARGPAARQNRPVANVGVSAERSRAAGAGASSVEFRILSAMPLQVKRSSRFVLAVLAVLAVRERAVTQAGATRALDAQSSERRLASGIVAMPIAESDTP